MFAEPLVFRAARPLDAEEVRDLAVRHAKAPRLADRDAVRLDLGWPIHVVVAAVPQLLPRMPLSDVGEFVEGIEGEGFLVPLLSIAEAPVNDFSRFLPGTLTVLGVHHHLPL